jgi:hypothetical protein
MPTDERRFAPVDCIAWSPRHLFPSSFDDQSGDFIHTHVPPVNEEQTLDAINDAIAAVIASTPAEAPAADAGLDARDRPDRGQRQVERLRKRFAKEFARDPEKIPIWFPDRIGNAIRLMVVSPVRWTSRTLTTVWSVWHSVPMSNPGGMLALNSAPAGRMSIFDHRIQSVRTEPVPSDRRPRSAAVVQTPRKAHGDRIRVVIRIPVMVHRKPPGGAPPINPQRGGTSKVSRVSTLNLL